MSQTDRKYDGAPHSEAKKLPVEPPNKLGPRKSKTTQEDEYNVRVWKLANNQFPDSRWWWYTRKTEPGTLIPCLGREFGSWCIRMSMEHVVKRMKAVVRKSRPCDIYWLEEQGTRRQLSPEFSNFRCFMNWVIHYGFSKDWLKVGGFRNRKGELCRRLDKL